MGQTRPKTTKTLGNDWTIEVTYNMKREKWSVTFQSCDLHETFFSPTAPCPVFIWTERKLCRVNYLFIVNRLTPNFSQMLSSEVLMPLFSAQADIICVQTVTQLSKVIGIAQCKFCFRVDFPFATWKNCRNKRFDYTAWHTLKHSLGLEQVTFNSLIYNLRVPYSIIVYGVHL